MQYYDVELTVSDNTYRQPGVQEAFVARVLDLVAVVGRQGSFLVSVISDVFVR